MNWNEHSDLKGKHAILSPSQYSWLRYTDQDDYASLIKRCKSEYASEIGTIIHDYAQLRILNNLPMSYEEKNAVSLEILRRGIPSYAFNIDQFFQTVVEYVNDAISYKMTPEVTLFYSNNAFGHCDAISYGRKILRIHDLKTGVSSASFDQLIIYAAYFFLEYGKKMKLKPEQTEVELRLYQLSEISICHPEPEDVYAAIDKILELDPVIEAFKSGGFING